MRTVLISGGSRGIGAAIVKAFAAAGDRVAFFYRENKAAAAAVENGEIYMESAACPDQICVEHGPLRPGGTPIVCLPNRLSIQWIERDAAVDAVSGGR